MKETIRKIIRKIINETVSAPGTTFGPYHDEVVLSKEKTKPQYFNIAINRATQPPCTESAGVVFPHLRAD